MIAALLSISRSSAPSPVVALTSRIRPWLPSRPPPHAVSAAATEMRRHLTEIERSLSLSALPVAPALRDVFEAYRTR